MTDGLSQFDSVETRTAFLIKYNKATANNHFSLLLNRMVSKFSSLCFGLIGVSRVDLCKHLDNIRGSF